MFYAQTDAGYRPLAEGVEMKSLVHGAQTHMVVFRISAGSGVPAHRHPHEQTGFLVSGRLAMTVGDRTVELGPGDAWNIPGDAEHSAEALEACTAIEVFSPVREDYLKAAES